MEVFIKFAELRISLLLHNFLERLLVVSQSPLLQILEELHSLSKLYQILVFYFHLMGLLLLWLQSDRN
jgi:hypothetical protein